MNISNLKRFNVVGTSGSGKSTFSKALSKKLNIPYIEMDSIFWKPNWTESTDHEFFPKLERSLAPEKWVLDGNYNRSIPIKWKYVEAVIWIDYSFKRVMYQATKRAIFRIATRKELWPNTNNREKFHQTFLSKKSILLWTIQTYQSNKIRYESMMKDQKYSHIKFIRIKSPAEATNFLKNLG